MGAMVPPPRWIPEDDLLLRNAVEAGASLESLAKGAVQFSQRFTIQELQDRWYSILYDPIVSEEASVGMTELELSSFHHQSRPNPNNKPEIAKEKTTCTSMRRRKSNSIRKCYYAMRKRICNEPFDMMDIDILSEPPGNSNFGDGNELSTVGRLIGNPNPDNLGIPSISTTMVQGEVAGFGPSNQLPLSNMFDAGGLESIVNPCADFVGPSFDDGCFACPSPLPQIPIWGNSTQDQQQQQHTGGEAFILPEASGGANDEGGALGYGGGLPSFISDDYITQLFDFTNDDEILFADTNGTSTLDKSDLDIYSSHLLDSPNQIEFPIIEGLGEDTTTVAPIAEDVHIIGGDMGLRHCDQRNVPEAQVVTSVTEAQVVTSVTETQVVISSRCLGPEYRNGVICCILNTEDPEIPSNDDVFLPVRFPLPTNSSEPYWKSHDPPSYLVRSSSSSVKDFSSTRKANGGGPPPMMKNNQRDACGPSQGIRSSSLPLDSNSKYPTGVRYELPKSNIQSAALRNSRTGECVPSSHIGGSINSKNGIIIGSGAMEMEWAGPGLDKHAPGPDIIHQSLQKSVNADFTIQREVTPKPVDKDVLSDQEEQLSSENEYDVPYFSDVEAMILDMDLSPAEFDLYSIPEVQQYQHEETKRTIVRLEQAANSCMQRAIVAQGALAVLYGRCSKHFIKKSEVVLGRATEDVEVDIDLGREKNGAKISRRQAIIKKDMHGAFHLKNVGKSSVYVNDKEVATGQRITLTSGCLIEVRGMAFVFETNDAPSIMNGGDEFVEHKPWTRS